MSVHSKVVLTCVYVVCVCVCVGGGGVVGVFLGGGGCVYALKIVSFRKIVRCTATFVIIYLFRCYT